MDPREGQAAADDTQQASLAASAAALYEAGLEHLRAGRYLNAQRCCRQAIETDPAHADSLHLMGLLTLHAGDFDLAAEWIARAIRQEARPQYLFSLGTSLQQGGRPQEALQAFDQALETKPDATELWRHRGNALADLERWEQALSSFQEVLKLDPHDHDAAFKSGTMLFNLERPDEALALANLSDWLRPDHAPTLQLRALAQSSLGRTQEALADIERAHALDPENAETCHHMGTLLNRLGNSEAALAWFDRALGLQPGYLPALLNKSFALMDLHRFDQAFAALDAIKAIDPGHAEAEWARAMLNLLLGHFAAGWAGREVRWQIPHLSLAQIPKSIWVGEQPLDGRTILIYADEGLGDTIHFVRYVPMLAERGARVVLMVSDALHPLLAAMPGVAQCVPISAGAPSGVDTFCRLSSLPLAFGTTIETIPAARRYLPPPDAARIEAWERRLGAHDTLRVGLVWSGNPNHRNDHNRSMPLRTLLPLLDLDARFVSLQKPPRPEDETTLRGQDRIVDLTGHLTDFLETAALVSCLDLVITVDTSVAHLSAALGRPTWILLPYTPDFRWLLDRDDSPWYPTVRLFRQSSRRDYAEVIARVRAELKTQIAAWADDRKGGRR